MNLQQDETPSDGVLSATEAEASAQAQTAGRSRWSTAFLMVGSALAGATALAFWNRRTISNMRARIEAGPAGGKPTAAKDEEIV